MRPFHLRSVITAFAAGLALLGCAGTPATEGISRDFVAMTTAGDEISGESIRGHVTIVDFWAVF